MIEQRQNNGVGILGLLGIVFVVLKLCGVIDWPWWLVTLPFWGVPAILISLFLFGYFLIFIVQLFSSRNNRVKRL